MRESIPHLLEGSINFIKLLTHSPVDLCQGTAQPYLQENGSALLTARSINIKLGFLFNATTLAAR